MKVLSQASCRGKIRSVAQHLERPVGFFPATGFVSSLHEVLRYQCPETTSRMNLCLSSIELVLGLVIQPGTLARSPCSARFVLDDRLTLLLMTSLPTLILTFLAGERYRAGKKRTNSPRRFRLGWETSLFDEVEHGVIDKVLNPQSAQLS